MPGISGREGDEISRVLRENMSRNLFDIVSNDLGACLVTTTILNWTSQGIRSTSIRVALEITFNLF